MSKWLQSTTCIKFAVTDGVARITLNRPDKRNAMNDAMLRELNGALLEADDLKEVRAVVLEGAGIDFCSGYDVMQAVAYRPDESPSRTAAPEDGKYRSAESFDDDAWSLERMNDMKMILFDMHKPVIAKVHGRCVAGGTDIALMCDMVIAADDALIGFPATRLQGSPPNHWWLYHVGPQWAKRLLLTGDLIRGSDAAKINLVLKAVPSARLEDEVLALAKRLTLIDADLLSAQKRIVNIGLELMGARTLQRMASEMDARAHLNASRQEFRKLVQRVGLAKAFKERDSKFGTGEVSID